MTLDNAAEVGEQVNAVIDMWDAMSVENGERADVQKALDEVVHPLFEAVLAAEDSRNDRPDSPEEVESNPSTESVATFSAYAKGNSKVTVSALEKANDLSSGSICSGVIELDGGYAVDSSIPTVSRTEGISKPISVTGYSSYKCIENSNEAVVNVSCNSTDGTLRIVFKPAGTAGESKVMVEVVAQYEDPRTSMTNYATLYFEYEVSSTGRPEKPEIDDVPSNGYIYFKCEDHAAVQNGLLSKLINYWSFGEVTKNDGRFDDKGILAEDYPWFCEVQLNQYLLLNLWNNTFVTGSIRAHHLVSPEQPPVAHLYWKDNVWYYDKTEYPMIIWIAQKWPLTLNYDANGGSNAPDSMTLRDDSYARFVASSQEPIREGYKFLGWNTSPNDSYSLYNPGDAVYVYPSSPVKTLYAVWAKIPRKPTHDEVYSLTSDVVVKCNSGWHRDGKYDCIAVPGKENHTDRANIGEVVWNDSLRAFTCDVTFVAEKYVDTYSAMKGKEHTLASGEKDKIITLRWSDVSERWQISTPKGTVTFSVECGNDDPVYLEPNTPTHREVYDLTDNVCVKCETNPNHKPWNFDCIVNEKGTDNTDRVAIGEVKWDAGLSAYTCDVTFLAAKYAEAYSQLKGETHTLIDGEGDKVVTLRWDVDDEEWTLPEGYEGPLTFFVECSVEKQITVTWLDGYNEGDDAVIKSEKVDPDPDFDSDEFLGLYPEENPEREGDEFAGWGEPVTDEETGNITITAQWKNQVTVTWLDGYNEGDDAVIKSERIDPNPDLDSDVFKARYPGDPTREGYEFSGWGKPVTDGETGNVTITATWQINSIEELDQEAEYLVVWRDQDGNIIKPAELRGPEKVGTKVAVTDADKAGVTGNDGVIYAFKGDDGRNVLAAKLMGEGTVLTLYFEKVADTPVVPTPGTEISEAPTPGPDDSQPILVPLTEQPAEEPSLVDSIVDFLETPVIPVASPVHNDGDALADIADEGTPLSAFDHPFCWVHYYIILGLIITAIYGGGVIARRLGYNHKIRRYEDDVTGRERRKGTSAEPADKATQPTI